MRGSCDVSLREYGNLNAGQQVSTMFVNQSNGEVVLLGVCRSKKLTNVLPGDGVRVFKNDEVDGSGGLASCNEKQTHANCEDGPNSESFAVSLRSQQDKILRAAIAASSAVCAHQNGLDVTRLLVRILRFRRIRVEAVLLVVGHTSSELRNFRVLWVVRLRSAREHRKKELRRAHTPV